VPAGVALIDSAFVPSVSDDGTISVWVGAAVSAKDGVFSVEVQAFLEATGTERATLRSFLSSDAWCFPKNSSSESRALWRVFDDRRVSSTDPQKVKASCREFLGLYALLRHFVECRVASSPAHAAARESFLAVCNVLDWLLAAKFRTSIVQDAAAELEAATVRFVQLHKVGNRSDAVVVGNLQVKAHLAVNFSETCCRVPHGILTSPHFPRQGASQANLTSPRSVWSGRSGSDIGLAI
jgi:hypothetical protein